MDRGQMTISLYELAERLGGQLSLPARQAMVGTNVPATMDILFADIGLTPDPDERAEAAAWIDKRMGELYSSGNLPWRPGAAAALTAIRATGLPSALVTSTDRWLTELALDTLGRPNFDATVCGDEVNGLNKPHPEPYLKAARLLAVDPRSCVAIEDSPSGTASAVAAGCTVVVIPSETAVPPGPRRHFRESLVGLTLADLPPT